MKALKALSTMAVGAVLAAGMIPAANAAPQFQRRSADRVCFYQDINYQGWEQCYNSGDEVANLDGRRNSISSIRIFGRSRVVVYEDTNFRGNSEEFTGNVPDLGLRVASGSRTWSDRIESIQIVADSRNRGYGDREDDGYLDRDSRNDRQADRQGLRDGICVYEHANYQGRSECWSTGDVADLGRLDRWSDIISSIRVYGRASAVLFRDIGFRGEYLEVNSDIADLARFRASRSGTWNDQVSSIQVESDRRNRGRGLGRGRIR